MYFIVIILLKIPQAYQDLVVPGRNSFSLPFPTITMKYIPPAVTMGGWRQCQSEEHLFALNPLSSAPSILRVTLKRWISTTVNNLPCIRKQNNTRKGSRHVTGLLSYSVEKVPLELSNEVVLPEFLSGASGWSLVNCREVLVPSIGNRALHVI